MARVRARAMLSASSACRLVGVASRRRDRARSFADEFGCPHSTDDYKELARCEPQAILVEVPHSIQDEVVLWALDRGFHVLVGGPLATNTATGVAIARSADERGLVVETGYEARYKPCWKRTRDHVNDRRMGKVVAIRTVAFHDQDDESWYYNERLSGGMILTHMSYTFINPLRWIFGTPRLVSAFSNRKKRTGPDYVRHETCAANIVFDDDVVCSMIASYVKPPQWDAWNVHVLGTDGALEIHPGDLESGSLVAHVNGTTTSETFDGEPNAFEEQAKAFVGAVAGTRERFNPAWDSVIDLQVCEAIAKSAERKVPVPVDPIGL